MFPLNVLDSDPPEQPATRGKPTLNPDGISVKGCSNPPFTPVDFRGLSIGEGGEFHFLLPPRVAIICTWLGGSRAGPNRLPFSF